MQCANCGVEISAAFKFAFVKNECPACGNKILDSDSIELIRNVKELLSSEIEITDDAAHNLAMLIVSNFSVSFKTGKVAKSATGIKLYKPAVQGFVTANDIPNGEGISQEERDRIMEEVVRSKYNLTDQTIMPVDEDDVGLNLDINPDEVFNAVRQKDLGVPASGFDINPVLEQERLRKLAYQKSILEGGQSLGGGKSAVRRG